MDWHQYLREERAQKLMGLAFFSARKLSMAALDDNGEHVDKTDEAIERLRRNIAQIEEILQAAGQPLDP